MIIRELFIIAVYNTPTYSTVYTTVSLVLIESTIIITSSTTAMCCSYTTTINKSPEVSNSIPIDSNGVPGEGGVVVLLIHYSFLLYTVITGTFPLTLVLLSQFVNPICSLIVSPFTIQVVLLLVVLLYYQQ